MTTPIKQFSTKVVYRLSLFAFESILNFLIFGQFFIEHFTTEYAQGPLHRLRGLLFRIYTDLCLLNK